MKKLIIYTLLSILFLPLFSLSSFAQEDNSQTETQYFDISIQKEGQSAFNKAITYTVYVTPKIDSTRTQIIWDAPSLVEIRPKHDEFVDMYIGQTYSFKANIIPLREGTCEISVNLIAWQHDTNYTNSVSDILTINTDLLSVPIEPSYTYGNIAKILIIVLICIGAIFGGVLLFKKGLKAFKKWITPPV
jgi:hypothetical protein